MRFAFPVIFFCATRLASQVGLLFVSAGRYCASGIFQILFLIMLLAGVVRAVQAEELAYDTGMWQIVADKVAFDKKTQSYTAEGNVVLKKDDSLLSADYLYYNRLDNVSFARGNVVIDSADKRLDGESIAMDHNTNTASIKSGKIFLKSGHMYIRGTDIQKTGEDTYSAAKVSVTTCDGDNPDWQIAGQNLNLRIEGYGTIYHAVFKAKKMPLLYSPWLLFPVKIKRQTGLLAPEIGNSTRMGTEYIQPFFWAINRYSDLTFYYHAMAERGDKVGFEYRILPDDMASATIMADWFKDQKIDDGSEEMTGKWGYNDTPDRLNQHRYWFRMKSDFVLPGDITGKIDLDTASDQDYLRDFNDGYTGFAFADTYFEDTFGRGLEDEDDMIRTNSIVLTANNNRFTFNVGSNWYDDLRLHHEANYGGIDVTDTTLQELLYIEANSLKTRIWQSPLYYQVNAEANWFYRRDRTTTAWKGKRVDFLPRVYLPLSWKNYLNFEPSAGYRGTLWYIGDDSDNDNGGKGTYTPDLYDLKAELSTDIYKIYNTGLDDIDKVKHSMRPEIIWEYLPDKDQDDLPYFDTVDLIERKNLVTWSLTHVLKTRTRQPSEPDAKKNSYLYRDICTFEISQSYDIYEKNEDDPLKWRNGFSKEPFSPITLDLLLTPSEFVFFTGDAQWSPYENRFVTTNGGMSLKDSRGDSITADYRHTRRVLDPHFVTTIETVAANCVLRITNSVSLFGGYERDIREKKGIETVVGLDYNAGCWGVKLQYIGDEYDKKYMLSVDLSGLGDLRTRFSKESVDGWFE